MKEWFHKFDTSARCNTTMENDDDTVLIVKGVVQPGLSFGVPPLESGGLRFEFQCHYLLNLSFVKVT